MPLPWTLVVPVRHPERGKSRLGAGAAVARAIAVDTLAAAAPAAHRLILMTDADDWTAGLPGEVRLQRGPGLSAAVAEGVAAAGDGPVAVLPGDLPALRTADLAAALAAAEAHPLARVPDHEGTGTTLITALRGAEHRPAFGDGSNARHAAAGYAELVLPATSTLRRDVDRAADLAALAEAGLLGAATRSALREGDRVAGDRRGLLD